MAKLTKQEVNDFISKTYPKFNNLGETDNQLRFIPNCCITLYKETKDNMVMVRFSTTAKKGQMPTCQWTRFFVASLKAQPHMNPINLGEVAEKEKKFKKEKNAPPRDQLSLF